MSDTRRYGVVDGKDVFSRDEYIFEARGFGEILEGQRGDRFLLEYARKVTSDWYRSGHHHSFESFYLGDYCLDHPMCDLTTREYERLKELQKEAIAEKQRIEDEKEWRYDHTIYWADNSEEEIWINKYGEKKSVMAVAPHGDVC